MPEWYIESCKRIKYLAVYFTLKGDEFDVEAVLGGAQVVKKKLTELSIIIDKDVREKSRETTLELMLETFHRGYSFLPVNINKSDALHHRKRKTRVISYKFVRLSYDIKSRRLAKR